MGQEQKSSYLFGEPKFLVILCSLQITSSVLKRLKLKPVTCSHQSVPQAGTLHVLASLTPFLLNKVQSDSIQDL